MRPLTPPTPKAARPRVDPAPSRVAYRAHRLWLTPMVRVAVRVGFPLFSLAFAVGFVAKTPQVTTWFETNRTEIYRAFADRPEFLVRSMLIEGASDSLVADIRMMLDLDLPISRFDLDLPSHQARVAELDPVADVNLAIRPGGVLTVKVTERVAAVIWQAGDGDEVLDSQGRRVAAIGPDAPPLLDAVAEKLPHLPIVAGPGADTAVPEALTLVDAAAPLGTDLLGLVRVGERRWDVVLSNGVRIMLPEQRPEQALNRVLAAHAAEALLDRAIAAVDLRNPERPTVRLTEPALDRLWQIRSRSYPAGELN